MKVHFYAGAVPAKPPGCSSTPIGEPPLRGYWSSLGGSPVGVPSRRQPLARQGFSWITAAPVPPGFAGGGGSLLKMGAYLLLTCIALPFVAVISLFFIQETRRALDVALGFSLLTFLSSVGL